MTRRMTGLKDWRRMAGVTQQELARLAGVSRASISHVETGRFPVSAKMAGKLCRSMGQLLGLSLRIWDLLPEQFSAPEIQGPLPGADSASPVRRRRSRRSG